MAVPFSAAMESQLNRVAAEPLAAEPDARSGCETNESASCGRQQRVYLDSTLSIDDAARIEWEAVVIGAGPTGALAARQLAFCGLRTLLVDRSSFPRDKVCGGCVSGLGRRLLERVGLGEVLGPSVAAPLGQFDLAAAGRRVSFEIPAGAAVSRFHFDAELVRFAIDAGVEFVSGTTALVRGLTNSCHFRTLVFEDSSRSLRTRARFVIAADGLGRSSLKRHRAFAAQVAAASRIGLGATLPGSASSCARGCVLMSVGRDGYVGMVQLPDDTLNLAAALDPSRVRRCGPAEAVRGILLEAGVDVPLGLETVEWRGTGLLTRRSPRLAARRLLLLGDAAGYVEPFTGEGMTWGLMSAVLAAPLVAEWLACDSAHNSRQFAARREFDQFARAWAAVHRRHIAPRQRDCRLLAGLLRRPAAVRPAMRLLSVAPNLAAPFIRHFWNSDKDIESTHPWFPQRAESLNLGAATKAGPRTEKDSL